MKEKRINYLSCTFDNPVRENDFLEHSWKEKSFSIIVNLIIYALTGTVMLIFSYFEDSLNFKIGLSLFIINIAGSSILFYRGDSFRKKYTHYIVTIMNVLWVYFLTFAGFFDNIILAMAITPLAFLIYLVKVFPFNFLWCVIPGTISMLISIIYTGITISQYHHTDLILISNLYYVANFLLWFIIIYDKWRFEKISRIDFLKSETIETTKKLMHQTLNRYFGDVLSEKIISEDGALVGETKWVTICFTDISSYSTIVEYMSPAVAVEFLNEYFSAMHKVIEKYGGQILNYIGDSIMIVFGAPNNLKNHEKVSIECALEMREELKSLNRKWDKSELSRYWKNHGIEKINSRIGIHTGNVIAGNIGSDKMLQYSTIGDVVNVASRLEQANKEFDTDICMSQEIYTALTSDLIDKANFVGEITLKGRTAPSKVFSI